MEKYIFDEGNGLWYEGLTIFGRVRRKSWTQKLFAHEAPNRRVSR